MGRRPFRFARNSVVAALHQCRRNGCRLFKGLQCNVSCEIATVEKPPVQRPFAALSCAPENLMLRLQVDEVALTHPPLKSRTSGGSNACRLLPIEQTRRSSSRTPDSASFMPMRDSADRLGGQSTTYSGGKCQS